MTAEAPSTVAVPAHRTPSPPPSVPAKPGSAPGGTSPVTGQPVALILLSGLSLILFGATLLYLTRHRPTLQARRYTPSHARR